MESTMEICDPRAPLPRGEGLLPKALDGLAGKVVGFIDNTKPNFNHLIDDLADVLVRKYGVRAVLKRGKRLQSIPAPEAVIDELAAACDLVITGSGDWGACASWSIHDSVEAVKRGRMAVTVCSTAFETLGRRQAAALGCAELPIAFVPHPFGLRARAEIPPLAEDVATQIAALMAQGGAAAAVAPTAARAETLAVPADMEALHRYCIEQQLSDGLPVIAPTLERVARMLAATRHPRDTVIARIAPGYGDATVERIAANAVMAGCAPACMNVLIAALRAVAAPEFNLQGIQATTNPAAVWLVVNGPVAKALAVNAGTNCLGQGAAANLTLGRALRLILQNIGGAFPGEMDRATHGQPGKISMCCAENEAASPWQPLQVERGFAVGAGTVTAIGFSGTLNMNSHSKNADEILRTLADAMAHGPSNDYWCGGEPWIVISPEHAQVLAQAGLTKADVKRRLWEQSKMVASRMADKDFERTCRTRHDELGAITPETMLPVSRAAQDIGILVAGGEGTHSVYVPGFGNSRSVTRAVDV